MKRSLPLLLALLVVPVAHADGNGPWQIKFGVHDVSPKSGNGSLAGGSLKTDVGDSTRPTLSLEYGFNRNLGLEVLAAAPFRHDVKLNGSKAASVKQLPPTVSLQWHFLPDRAISPFVGLGVNYTRFFSIDETGPLAGTRLDLDSSWGLAAHAGVDFAIDPNWSVTVDARWIRISSDAKVNGAKVGTVDIDPRVFGVAVGYRF